MSKAALDNEIRNNILTFLTQILSEHYDSDVLDVSASEITMPVVDSEGNEKFAVIKVSIPRGSRTDGPYDGYAAHEEWELDKADKADKAEKRKERDEHAAKEKERKRAARKVIKQLNNEGFQALIHKPEEPEGE